MSISLPRETLEFLPITVTVDGQEVTAGVKVCVVTGRNRPTEWVDPVELDGKIGVLTEGHAPGTYKVYAQITDAPEIPVVLCGSYTLT